MRIPKWFSFIVNENYRNVKTQCTGNELFSHNEGISSKCKNENLTEENGTVDDTIVKECECNSNCSHGCCGEKECSCKNGDCNDNHVSDEDIKEFSIIWDERDNIENDICGALDNILENIDFVKNILYTEGKCKECGGYILFHLSDPQLEILKMLGLTLSEGIQYCNCKIDKYQDDSQKNDNDETLEYNDDILDKVLNYEVEISWATKDGVEVPSKSEEDLGYDIRAHFEEDELLFQPFETKLVPTGVYAAMPNKHWGLIAKEKGSTGALGIRCGAGVIDSGYRDEIFIAITNDNPYSLSISKDPNLKKPIIKTVPVKINELVARNEERIYYPYTKGICQLLLVRNIPSKSKKITIEELQSIPSKRGTGKLGSTDNIQ